MELMLAMPNPCVKHVEHYLSENVRMTLQDRINELFDDSTGATNAQLARFVGCSRATVTDWRNGKTKTIEGENAYKVAEFFGDIEPFWVQTGKGKKHIISITNPAEARRIAEIAGGVNIEPGPDITGRVPLISWVQAGNWSEVIDNYLPGQAEDWRLTTAKCSKHAYALRVVGDSMTNPHGAPSIPEGYIVIVEPDRSAKNGDIVIARLDDSMEATIKKLVIEGNTRYLKPLNPSYPVIHINGNCTICGVVIKVEFDL